MAFENAALDEMIEDYTDETIAVHIHSGARGANGTGNRIGTLTKDLAAATWGSPENITNGAPRRTTTPTWPSGR